LVDYTLSIQSDPTGIEIQIQVSGESYFRVTPYTLTKPDGTSITLIAPKTVGEPQGTEERAWSFTKWKDNGTVIATTVNTTLTLDADKTRKAYYEQLTYFPTRNPSRRASKFEGKADEDVMKLRTDALKSMMVEQQEVTTAQQERLEKTVGDVMQGEGLYGMQLHHYRNFSQELYGLTRLFRGDTLNKEASLKAEKWRTRLVADGQPDATVKSRLQKIANIYGITLTFT